MSPPDCFEAVLTAGRAVNDYSVRQTTHGNRLIQLMARFNELSNDCLDFCFANRETLAEMGLLDSIAAMMRQQVRLTQELNEYAVATTESEQILSEKFGDAVDKVLKEVEAT